jgi:hypothetical protein
VPLVASSGPIRQPSDPGLLSAVAFQKRVNHTEGGTARGGMLTVDAGRFTFTPHRMDRALGGASIDVPLTEIAEVGAEPRTWRPFDGGMRTRLRVVLADGERHLFVLNGLQEVIAHLQADIDEARRAG